MILVQICNLNVQSMQYTSQNIVHVHIPLLRAFIYVTITLAADTSRVKMLSQVAVCHTVDGAFQ
jgi:hypothetical protein